MKHSEVFKTVWWGILVFLVGCYLFGRYSSLIEGNPSYFDLAVFLAWIGICLAPIFQEMDIFGVKLKQKIDELNKDINCQLSMLKTETKSSIEVSNANSNQIYFQNSTAPPKDSEIPNISLEIKHTLERMGINLPQEFPDFPDDFEVDPAYVEMFKVRLAFESLLKEHFEFNEKYHRRYSVGKILNDLRNYEAFSKQVLDGVMEVISVCNYAVHGEPITKVQVAFVRESAPGLLKALAKELKASKKVSQVYSTTIDPVFME